MSGQDVFQVAEALCNQRAGGRFDTVCRPLVSTAQPAAVRMSAQELRAKLMVLVNLLTRLEASRDALMKVWSSQSAATATAALTSAFSTFQKTIDATNTFIQLLEGSADKLDTAMSGTNQAVGQSEPRIAACLANPQPASQQAARAMAVGTTAQTSGFLSGQRAALTASAGSINGSVLGGLTGILNSINQLMGAGTATTATAAAPTVPPLTLPTLTPPALTLPPTTLPNTTLPTMALPTTTPIPTADQPYPYGFPTATPAAGGDHLVQLAFHADGSFAGAQSDIPIDVHIDEVTAGGRHLVNDIQVSADGRTTTTTT